MNIPAESSGGIASVSPPLNERTKGERAAAPPSAMAEYGAEKYATALPAPSKKLRPDVGDIAGGLAAAGVNFALAVSLGLLAFMPLGPNTTRSVFTPDSRPRFTGNSSRESSAAPRIRAAARARRRR